MGLRVLRKGIDSEDEDPDECAAEAGTSWYAPPVLGAWGLSSQYLSTAVRQYPAKWSLHIYTELP